MIEAYSKDDKEIKLKSENHENIEKNVIEILDTKLNN